jgi:hypothetical protein
MTTILDYYKYAALAAASYVRVGPDVIPSPAPNEPAVLGDRFANEANRQGRPQGQTTVSRVLPGVIMMRSGLLSPDAAGFSWGGRIHLVPTAA